MRNTAIVSVLTILVYAICPSLQAKDSTSIIYSPYVEDNFPKNVYWGDTHLHTSLSFDSYGEGNTKMGSDVAYDFARGKVIKGHDGLPVRISRPIDFIVIADHAEYMGVVQGVNTGDKLLQATEPGARWSKMAREGDILQVFGEMVNDGATNQPRQLSDEFTQSVWAKVIDYAELYNDPGVFTAFIGYEYSSLPDGGDNLHRVVMFRDGAEKTSQVAPFSLFDGEDPEQLWDYFARYEKKTGGQVISIPHNGNLSAGRMFALKGLSGKPLTAQYAEKRMRWEPLVETTQMKGDSETHPALSPDDEFADFETWDLGNIIVTKRTSPELMQFEYSRSALKHGLAQRQILGKNPFKFGMIGATDSHTSFSNAEEDNFLGKYATASPAPDRWKKKFPPLTVPGVLEQFTEWQTSQSGYAAVWSTENTRESIFDAMKRKEVYATTGPRMTVRTFGGFDFSSDDAYSSNFARIGYQKGVPMGGDLPAAPSGKKFSMMIAASKDPDGANLDRIQVIKGWVDSKGKQHERIYDAAVSDGRNIGNNGRCETPVGSTVDLKTATYMNTIGDAVLVSTWVDPDFDPAVSSFYYVRVLEIPTPRWTAFDALRYKLEMPEEVTMVLQERAYTSPIWYTPEK